jgi:hypothetical protein
MFCIDAQNPGWHYGLSYTDNKSFVCPKIPKCASSWAEKYFLELGWEKKSFSAHGLFVLNALVFLREPKERYIAGLGEFLSRNYDFLYPEAITSVEFRNRIFKHVFSKLRLDPHTTLQPFFIQNLTNPVYFKVDDSLSESVASFLGTPVNNTFVNSKINGLGWREFALDYLANNESATKTLDFYLKPDYDLFNSVRFN